MAGKFRTKSPTPFYDIPDTVVTQQCNFLTVLQFDCVLYMADTMLLPN
jgi:hypothetical protein